MNHDKALVFSARVGDLTGLQAALKAGASPFSLEADTHYTPMALAAKHGHVDCIEALIEAGVDINTPVESNQYHGLTTALILAVSEMRVAAVDYLIKHGADVHGMNHNKDDALKIAALCYGKSEQQECIDYFKIIKSLISNGAHHELNKMLLWTFNEDPHCVVMVKFLIEQGADPLIRLPGKLTLLEMAEQNTNKVLVNYLQVYTESQLLKQCVQHDNERIVDQDFQF